MARTSSVAWHVLVAVGEGGRKALTGEKTATAGRNARGTRACAVCWLLRE